MKILKMIVSVATVIVIIFLMESSIQMKIGSKDDRIVETVDGYLMDYDMESALHEEVKFDNNKPDGDEEEVSSLEIQVVEDKLVDSHGPSPMGLAGVKKVLIPVPTVIQTPELPNGCEITSLTAVLHYYDHQISKLTMADNYLPKESIVWEDDKRYGPDPYEAYAGDPRKHPGGWFSYAPPIIEAANQYALDAGSNLIATDISGSTEESIFSYLDQGIPVVIWVTKDLGSPKVTSSWYFHDTDEQFAAPVNLHVVVFNGYKGNQVYAMNPLIGQVTYNSDEFFESYEALGGHVLIVE